MRRASIREIIESPKDEYYVLVTRYYPTYLRMRGLALKDTPIAEWDRDLAPSPSLLKDWKSGKITWEEYEERFRTEVPLVLVKRKFQIYERDAEGKQVVFVCTEEDEEYPHCHTWILLNMLRE